MLHWSLLPGLVAAPARLPLLAGAGGVLYASKLPRHASLPPAPRKAPVHSPAFIPSETCSRPRLRKLFYVEPYGSRHL
jgi:hypothetical protein